MTQEHPNNLLKNSLLLGAGGRRRPLSSTQYCRLRKVDEPHQHFLCNAQSAVLQAREHCWVWWKRRQLGNLWGPLQILDFQRCHHQLMGLQEIRDSGDLIRDWLSDVTVYQQLRLIHFQKVTHCWSVSAAGAKPLARPYITLRTWGFRDLAGEARKHLAHHASFTFYGSVLSSRLPACFFSDLRCLTEQDFEMS